MMLARIMDMMKLILKISFMATVSSSGVLTVRNGSGTWNGMTVKGTGSRYPFSLWERVMARVL